MSKASLPVHNESPRRPSGRTLRVGDLAKRTGKTVRALHLYEELGLLTPTDRSPGGYRLYDRDSEVRVRWIGKLQDMGFSLSEIKELVSEVERSASAPDAMLRIRELYREKLNEAREQVRRMTALARELETSLDYLETCDSCDPRRLLDACTVCDRHDCTHETPELVAGFYPH